jgi:hypothetical protein
VTARPDQRRRRTLIGAVVAVVLAASAAGLTAVGANAVINSTDGEVVAADSRTVFSLPSTDNAALAVVDDDNRLTSLIVATLLPSGQGGSIVTIPVSADASIGFGEIRIPLDGVLDPNDPAGFFQQVEATLAVTLQFGEIIGAERLVELLGPTLPVAADLPVDVINSAGAGLVVDAGEQELDGDLLADVLQATDEDATERSQHSIDVSVWSGVAIAAPADGAAEVPVDGVGRPIASSTIDEVFARLWSDSVQVRDIALVSPQPAGSGRVVVLDRFDVVLIFSQISPSRVSTPNPGPVFRIEIPISDAQLESSESGLESRRDVGLSVIARLFFLQANVASIDATPSSDGAPKVTRVEVANEDFIETMRELGPPLFGEVEVVLAEELIDGIDVVVRLGTGYLDSETAEAAGAGADSGDPDASTPDDAATVDTDG